MKFGILIVILAITGLTSCIYKTVYDNGFEKKQVSLNGNKRKFTFTYLYPDSIPAYKEYTFEKYNKKLQDFELVDRQTVKIERYPPYIAPIDTMPIVSPLELKATYIVQSILPQQINFKDSSKFQLSGEGMSTCSGTPRYYINGKYIYDGKTVLLYYQRDQSLAIDTTRFTYYSDSLVLIYTDNTLFYPKYHLRN